MKKCRQCGVLKELSDFPFRKDKQRITARCKACVHVRQAAWLRQSRRAKPRVLPLDINEIVLGSRERLLERITAKTIRSASGCKEWPSSKDRGGYPMIFVKAGSEWFQIGAHRIIACLFHGLDLLDGDTLACHHCDNPSCCEESHIFAGSHEDNQRDAQRKGRLKGNTKPGPRPRGVVS